MSSIKRYVATSAREAMDRVRRELGDEAVILSNRRIGPDQVEILAAAPQTMEALVEQVAPPVAARRRGGPARSGDGRSDGRGGEGRGGEGRGIETRDMELRAAGRALAAAAAADARQERSVEYGDDAPPEARPVVRSTPPRTVRGEPARSEPARDGSGVRRGAGRGPAVAPESFQDYVRRQAASRAAEETAAKLRLHEAAGGTGAALYGAVADATDDDEPIVRPAQVGARPPVRGAAQPAARSAVAAASVVPPRAERPDVAQAAAAVRAAPRGEARTETRSEARAEARPAVREAAGDTPEWAPPEWFDAAPATTGSLSHAAPTDPLDVIAPRSAPGTVGAASARPQPAGPVADEPAVFRRRPSRVVQAEALGHAVQGASAIASTAASPAASAPSLASAPASAPASPPASAHASSFASQVAAPVAATTAWPAASTVPTPGASPLAPPRSVAALLDVVAPITVAANAECVAAAPARPAEPVTPMAAPAVPAVPPPDPRVLAELQALRSALDEQLTALSSVLMTRVDARLDATLGRSLVSELAASLMSTLAPTVAAAASAAASAAATPTFAAGAAQPASMASALLASPARAPIASTPLAVAAMAPIVPALPSSAASASIASPLPPFAAAAPVAAALPPAVAPAARSAPVEGPAPAAPVPVASPSAAALPAHPAPLHGPATAALTRLLMAGLSPDVARRISAHVGPDFPHAQVEPWLQQVLAANLRAEPGIDALIDQGGAIALVGPTGVGKTTTVAKLAARCAVKYGAAQLALVTLDAYRIGAHEQLRTYGQILGVPVHVAHDAATLRDVLQVLRGRRVVLIDTCGLSQRDPRLGAVLGMLEAAGTPERPVRRVLLVQAAAHAETLDEVARAWQAGQAHGAIMTKLDEAARIGGALDCLLRWKLPLVGLTNGQRVPEDWHAASTPLLAHIALKPAGGSFALQPGELTGEKTGERAAA